MSEVEVVIRGIGVVEVNCTIMVLENIVIVLETRGNAGVVQVICTIMVLEIL